MSKAQGPRPRHRCQHQQQTQQPHILQEIDHLRHLHLQRLELHVCQFQFVSTERFTPFLLGGPNGQWDEKTVDALKKFQAANNLPVMGRLNAETIQKLGIIDFPEPQPH